MKRKKSTPAKKLSNAMTLEELRFLRDMAKREGDFPLAFKCACAIDRKRGLYSLAPFYCSAVLTLASSAWAQSPPTNNWFTNQLTLCVAQNCFNETSNFMFCSNFFNISTNGRSWSYDVPLGFSWPCCEFCPYESFYVWASWTIGPPGLHGEQTTFSTNWISTTNMIQFTPYYVPGTNEIVHRTEYWTPGNTLTFRTTVNGAETWSGSPSYSWVSPPDVGSPGYVRGAVVSGSTLLHYTNVFMTNIWSEDGHEYKTTLTIAP